MADNTTIALSALSATGTPEPAEPNHGLRLFETHPAAVTGDWWALLNPLQLGQVAYSGECPNFNVWTPFGIDVAIYVGIPNDARRLWYNEVFHRKYFRAEDLTVGSILIESKTQRLIFIGPHPDAERHLVLADWPVRIPDLGARLLQKGPPEPQPLKDPSRMSKVAEGVDPTS